MPNNKSCIRSRVAAGAALVALSGFVPQPFMQEAHASSATMKVSGTFVAGVTIVNNGDVDFNKFAPSISTGTATVKTNGVGTGNALFFGTETNGKLQVKAVDTAAAVNVNITGLGTFNPVVSGTADLKGLIFGGVAANIVDALKSITRGVAATSATGTINFNTAVNQTTAQSMPVGAIVSWTGNRPRGNFQRTTTVTMSF